MPFSIHAERSCHRDDGRLVVRIDHQRKTSLVVWSVQLMLVSGIDLFGNSFLIKTDRFFSS